MIYIISTIHSIDEIGIEHDFQSNIIKYQPNVPEEYEWGYFKDIVCQGRKIFLNTTLGKMDVSKLEHVTTYKDDNHHLSVLYKDKRGGFTKAEYYLVPKSQMEGLVK